MNDGIGDRLREERKRLGYKNQADLADRLNVSPSSVHNYESGKRSPDAGYLSSLSGVGADVLYILTGVRSLSASQANPRLRALLDNYENSDDQGKAIIEGTASVAAQSSKVKKA